MVPAKTSPTGPMRDLSCESRGRPWSSLGFYLTFVAAADESPVYPAQAPGLFRRCKGKPPTAKPGLIMIEQAMAERDELAADTLAFICAALRSYGQLLLSTFLIQDYREALQLAAQMPADRAFRLTFGLTPLEVSQRILGEVNLAGIGASMFQPLPANAQTPNALCRFTPGRSFSHFAGPLILLGSWSSIPESSWKITEPPPCQRIAPPKLASPLSGESLSSR